MTVDRTPKACTHTRVTHHHGTSDAYLQDGCRCMPCSQAHWRRTKKYRLDKASGDARLIPVTVVRDHIRDLQDHGMSIVDIANAAGLSRTGVTRYLYGDKHRNANRRHVQRILTIKAPTTPGTPTGSGYLDATGTRRRIHALGALGWTQQLIADAAGMSRDAIVDISSGTARIVVGNTAAVIAEVYRTHAHRQPTHDEAPAAYITRAYAKRHGWLPPLAWDDDADLDDPATGPLPRFMWDLDMTDDARRHARSKWKRQHTELNTEEVAA